MKTKAKQKLKCGCGKDIDYASIVCTRRRCDNKVCSDCHYADKGMCISCKAARQANKNINVGDWEDLTENLENLRCKVEDLIDDLKHLINKD